MSAIKWVTYRPVFLIFVAACRRLGRDHDATLGTALRVFGRGDLFVRLRQQPSAPLVRTLERRLRQPAAKPIASRVAVMETVKAAYPQLPHPGGGMPHHKHWLFPTLTPEPERLMRHLWRHGFDATRGASNLTCVPVPDGHPVPANAQRLMAEVLYLPLYPSATSGELRRMARVIQEFGPASPANDAAARAASDARIARMST